MEQRESSVPSDALHDASEKVVVPGKSRGTPRCVKPLPGSQGVKVHVATCAAYALRCAAHGLHMRCAALHMH